MKLRRSRFSDSGDINAMAVSIDGFDIVAIPDIVIATIALCHDGFIYCLSSGNGLSHRASGEVRCHTLGESCRR